MSSTTKRRVLPTKHIFRKDQESCRPLVVGTVKVNLPFKMEQKARKVYGDTYCDYYVYFYL